MAKSERQVLLFWKSRCGEFKFNLIAAEKHKFAYTYARWIRNRYTVLDLAAEIVMLNEWRDEVLASVK